MSALCQGLCPPPWALCLPSFVSHPLSPMSCVRGCVRLPGLCVSHQSPNSLLLAFSILFQAVSGYVQMVVSGSPDVPNSFVPLWQFICLPIWLVVSSSLAVSNSFVSPCGNSFVSQSGWWCPALAVSNSFVLPCGNSFVCLPVWLVVSGSSAVSVTLVMSGSLAVSNSFVSKSGWWRLCLPNDSFVSQSGWWCPAFRLAPIHLSPLVTLHLSPSLAGGVRLSGCLQFICFRLVAIHLSPSLAGGVRLSMLSAVSNSFVFPCGN